MDQEQVARGEEQRTAPGITPLLIALVAFAVLAFGAVEYWSIAIVELGAVVLALVWFVGGVRRGAVSVDANLMLWAAGGFAVWATAQCLFALTLDRARTGGALTLFIAYLLIFIVVSNQPWPARSVERVHVAIAIIGFGTALLGLVQFLSWNGKLYWVRAIRAGTPFGPYVNHNHFAGLMEMAFPVALGLVFRRNRDGAGKALTALFAVTMAVATLVSLSRGGLAGLAVGTAMFFFLRARQRNVRGLATAAGLGGVLVLGGVLLIGVMPVMERLITFNNLGQEASFQSRIWIAHDTVRMIGAHLVAGTGLGTYALAIPRYLSFYTRWSWDKAHNDYLQLAAETGVVGAALALAWLAGFVRAFRARWRDSRAPSLALGAFCGCVAILVHSLADFNLQIPANALLFTVLAALATRRGAAVGPMVKSTSQAAE